MKRFLAAPRGFCRSAQAEYEHHCLQTVREIPGTVEVVHLGTWERKPVGSTGEWEQIADPSIVTKWVEGETLAEYVAKRSMTNRRLHWQKVASLTSTLVRTLEQVHAVGVVHGDVNPNNIIVQQVDHRLLPVLIDFGAAFYDDDDTSDVEYLPSKTAGTVPYLSPEQVAACRTNVLGASAQHNLASIDARTDVYGLGAVLYEMLSGRQPFTYRHAAYPQPPIDDPISVLDAIENQPPMPIERSRGVPAQLVRLCNHCLEKDPAK